MSGGKPREYGFSSNARDIRLAFWRSGTTNKKQYKTYLELWNTFCHLQTVDLLKPDLKHSIEFFVNLYRSDLNYSGINTARSSLSITCGWI